MLARQLVDAIHGVRLKILIFFHALGALFFRQRWQAVRGDGAWKNKFHAAAVAARLLRGQLQQIQRAHHVHLVRGLGRELAARGKQRGQMKDLIHFIHGQQALKQ